MLRAYLNKFVIAYLNNILIYSNNLKEHIKHITIVLTCLSKARLLLEPKKCKFYKKEVKFLGYIVGIYRVQISKEKIKVVKE
jgi:hypothetical protein